MANLETLRKTDGFTYSQILKAIDNFVFECGQYPAEALAHAVKSGLPLNAAILKEAFALLDTWAKEEEACSEKARTEASQRHIEENRPDVKFYVLWNRRKGDPLSLYKYVQAYDLIELQKYLKEIQEKYTHYSSLFAEKSLLNAIEFLGNQLRLRQPSASTPNTTAKAALKETEKPTDPQNTIKPKMEYSR